MKTTIVIVTYNRLKLLKECISCALNQINEEVELVIVNNKSTDGTFEYLQNLHNNKIYCLHEESNIGGAGGFHDGLKYANEHTAGEWFLLIDDDAMIDKNYLNSIFTYVKTDYKAYSGTVYVEGKIDIRHRSRLDQGAVPKEEYKHEKFLYDIATFCGLLIAKEVVMKIGYPRKDFFIWEDDTEYCYRLHKETLIVNVSSAILNHKTSNPNYKVKNSIRDDWKFYYGFRNQLVIYKNYHQYKKYYNKLFRLIGKILQLKLQSLVSIKNKEDYKYNSQIRIDAINDMKKNKMGKNPNY